MLRLKWRLSDLYLQSWIWWWRATLGVGGLPWHLVWRGDIPSESFGAGSDGACGCRFPLGGAIVVLLPVLGLQVKTL